MPALAMTHFRGAESVMTAEPEGLVSLMRRYADDDPTAFAELYRRMAPRLRGVIGSVVGGTVAVDDLLQVTIMRAHLARARFVAPAADANGAVAAWYIMIARNVALASLSESARRLVPTDDRQFAGLVAAGDPEAHGIDRQREQQTIDRVHDALGQLPATQRELIELHKLQGMSFGEIAKRLGVRETAARVRAHRAYRALARILGFGVEGGSA